MQHLGVTWSEKKHLVRWSQQYSSPIEMKGASIKEVQTHLKRVLLDECSKCLIILDYVRQRANGKFGLDVIWNHKTEI